jgi:hypothetical protein
LLLDQVSRGGAALDGFPGAFWGRRRFLQDLYYFTELATAAGLNDGKIAYLDISIARCVEMVNLTNLMKANTDNCRVHWESHISIRRQPAREVLLAMVRLTDQVDRNDVALVIGSHAHLGGDVAGDVAQCLSSG